MSSALRRLANFLVLLASLFLSAPANAQERPYFITYDHHLEEPASLEISFNPMFGTQRTGNSFTSSWIEIEYGLKGWWTTEFYLDGQKTFHDSSVFTGWRWENRFRPLLREHWINPVLYVELADINGADKTMREVVGHDVDEDFAPPNHELRLERKRELETKLILSSNFKGWNFSENIIAEKNLSNSPWEFGYAVALSRPLALAASPQPCALCRENFTAGLELYGGLGDRYSFGLRETSHYLAPALAWSIPRGVTLRISPGFGLNHLSHQFLLRFGVSYEINGFGNRIRQIFFRSKS